MNNRLERKSRIHSSGNTTCLNVPGKWECGRILGLNTVTTRRQGLLSTIDGEDLPIPCASGLPFEQVCVDPFPVPGGRRLGRAA